jgi:hypothetical protein
MVGITGESIVSGTGAHNLTALWANCHANHAESPPVEVNEPQLGAAPPRRLVTRSYRASSAQGPVKLRLGASHADTGSWYYAIDRVVLATGCSKSTRVPGGFVVSDRRKGSQRSRFNGRRGAFRIKGSLFGALARPTVSATVTIKKRGCSGEVVRFTARPSR